MLESAFNFNDQDLLENQDGKLSQRQVGFLAVQQQKHYEQFIATLVYGTPPLILMIIAALLLPRLWEGFVFFWLGLLIGLAIYIPLLWNHGTGYRGHKRGLTSGEVKKLPYFNLQQVTQEVKPDSANYYIRMGFLEWIPLATYQFQAIKPNTFYHLYYLAHANVPIAIEEVAALEKPAITPIQPSSDPQPTDPSNQRGRMTPDQAAYLRRAPFTENLGNIFLSLVVALILAVVISGIPAWIQGDTEGLDVALCVGPFCLVALLLFATPIAMEYSNGQTDIQKGEVVRIEGKVNLQHTDSRNETYRTIEVTPASGQLIRLRLGGRNAKRIQQDGYYRLYYAPTAKRIVSAERIAGEILPLYQAFEFTPEDVVASREGQLSSHKKAEVQAGLNGLWMMLGVQLVSSITLMLFAGIPLREAYLAGDNISGISAMFGTVILLDVAFVVFTLYRRHIWRAGRVARASGVQKSQLLPHKKDFFSYSLMVGKHRIAIHEDGYNALDPQASYTFYYWEYRNKPYEVLAVEAESA